MIQEDRIKENQAEPCLLCYIDESTELIFMLSRVSLCLYLLRQITFLKEMPPSSCLIFLLCIPQCSSINLSERFWKVWEIASQPKSYFLFFLVTFCGGKKKKNKWKLHVNRHSFLGFYRTLGQLNPVFCSLLNASVIITSYIRSKFVL